MIKIFKSRCKNCLMGKDRIVSPKRTADILKKCVKRQTHFLCHKNDKIICAGFNQEMGECSQIIQIAKRLSLLEFIQHEPHEKLITYEETQNEL